MKENRPKSKFAGREERGEECSVWVRFVILVLSGGSDQMVTAEGFWVKVTFELRHT